MKNALPCIFILLVAFFAGCKKEAPVNTDPFAIETQYKYVRNYNIVVKNDSMLVSVHYLDDSTHAEENKTIEYFGDSTAVITTIDLFPQPDTTVEIYYLNGHGHADSSYQTRTNSTPYSIYYHYNVDGYLHQTSTDLNNFNGLVYEYVNGNFSLSNSNYEYYPNVAKLDLYSTSRKLDNAITGRDDKNLPKRIRFANFDDSYYYQFDSNGYVTSMIIIDKYDGVISSSKYNYTYTFIQ